MAKESKTVQPDGEFSQVTVRIPTELRNQLFAAAEARVIGVAYLVTKALEDYLPRLIPMAELTKPEVGIGSVLASD